MVMKEEVQQKIDQLKSITHPEQISQMVKEIARQGGTPSLLQETKRLNTFQKADVFRSLMPDLKTEHLKDLLDLLEAEAKPIIGREEATVHSRLVKNLFDKISELVGEDVFKGVSLIDENEIISRIQSIRKKRSDEDPNA
jgi:hypothetical protein